MAWLLSLSSIFLSSLSLANEIPSGYIQDVQAEKNQSFYEIYLSNPETVGTIDYRDQIFTAPLTSEFKTRYEQKFGYIDASTIAFASNRSNSPFDVQNPVQSQESENAMNDRRLFAEYMVKRLSEWHLDNYFKSDPALRPLYEAKERLSRVEVQVDPTTKVEGKYSFPDNSVELQVQNPTVDGKVRVEMDPKAFGPSSIQENWLYIGRKISETLYALASYATMDGLAGLEFRKRHSTSRMSSSLKVTTTTSSGGHTPRQSFFGYALGYSW